MFALFLKGLVIGLAITAPVGPIGLLCIYRTIHDGFKFGLMTGMRAALVDGTYGLIAGLGLTTITSLLIANQFWIRIIGGILAGLGLGKAQSSIMQAFILVTGILLGLAFWWLLLSSIIAFVIQKYMSLSLLRIINWISASILIVFGLLALKL